MKSKIIIIFMGLIVVAVAGYFLPNFLSLLSSPAPSVFPSQEECERATDKSCNFLRCHYKGGWQTVDMVCGRGFKEGWTPTSKPILKDETANWKTYWNEEYGFEMKYPPEWEHGYDNPSAPKRKNFTHINLIDDRSFSISIQVTPAESVSSPPYYLRELEISKVALEMFDDPRKYEITNFNEVPAIKDGIYGGFTIFHRNPNYQIYIASASKVAEYGNYKTVDQATLDQIVSTFRFTR